MYRRAGVVVGVVGVEVRATDAGTAHQRSGGQRRIHGHAHRQRAARPRREAPRRASKGIPGLAARQPRMRQPQHRQPGRDVLHQHDAVRGGGASIAQRGVQRGRLPGHHRRDRPFHYRQVGRRRNLDEVRRRIVAQVGIGCGGAHHHRVLDGLRFGGLRADLHLPPPVPRRRARRFQRLGQGTHDQHSAGRAGIRAAGIFHNPHQRERPR